MEIEILYHKGGFAVMRKRIIAFVLAFMMVLGLLPGTGLENVLVIMRERKKAARMLRDCSFVIIWATMSLPNKRSAGYGLIMEILFIFINMIQTEKIRSFIARKNWV